MRVLIVQYAGDYRETFKRFATGGDETYYAQKYSVDIVAEISHKVEEVATLCCQTEEPYNEILENGVRAIGGGFPQPIPGQQLLRLVEQFKPTHLILRTPIRSLLRWVIQKKIKTLITLADSFNANGLRNKIRFYGLAKLLNNRQIDYVGNHSLTASISLTQIGVNPDKIIPWDWPSKMNPDTFSAKSIISNKDNKDVLYVGPVAEIKGVGDVIEAIAQLRAKGLSIQLKIAGKGDLEHFKNKVRHLQIENAVEFLGLVPNKRIVPLMREADLIIIPSRHEYPEGFPMTIYEALCSRTPIVASDHPMFLRKLSHRKNALIFPASNPVALAQCLEELLLDPELYQSLSTASSETWKSLQIPVKWGELVNNWLFDSPENQQWLFKHRLSSGQYKEWSNMKS